MATHAATELLQSLSDLCLTLSNSSVVRGLSDDRRHKFEAWAQWADDREVRVHRTPPDSADILAPILEMTSRGKQSCKYAREALYNGGAALLDAALSTETEAQRVEIGVRLSETERLLDKLRIALGIPDAMLHGIPEEMDRLCGWFTHKRDELREALAQPPRARIVWNESINMRFRAPPYSSKNPTVITHGPTPAQTVRHVIDESASAKRAAHAEESERRRTLRQLAALEAAKRAVDGWRDEASNATEDQRRAELRRIAAELRSTAAKRATARDRRGIERRMSELVTRAVCFGAFPGGDYASLRDDAQREYLQCPTGPRAFGAAVAGYFECTGGAPERWEAFRDGVEPIARAIESADSKQSTTILPTLKRGDREAWQANIAGLKQREIAVKLNEIFPNMKWTQPRVSEAIKRMQRHSDASGLSEKIESARPNPMARTLDPAAADRGQRTDGRAAYLRERERQKARDSDDE